jgi:hypothetical protein
VLLLAASLLWTSDKDGSLGTGEEIFVELSSGRHTITLSASDSHSNLVQANINILVGYEVYLPLIEN